MGIAGYGRAEKKQIQQMVKTILKMDKVPKPDDAADALAMAITHGNSAGGLGRHFGRGDNISKKMSLLEAGREKIGH